MPHILEAKFVKRIHTAVKMFSIFYVGHVLEGFNLRLMFKLLRCSQVEELAFLVKDNLPCKHLVLTMEESLINFLQDDSSG